MATDPLTPDTHNLRFGTTHWSNILGAASDDDQERRRSLQWLCRQYWNPVYAFLRRIRGLNPVEAEDRTQEFFAYLLEHEVISRADPQIGRFRTFMKAVLRNFLSAENRRDARLKRGGGQKAVPLETTDMASPDPGPDEQLDRDWARRVLELAREELSRRLAAEGRARDVEIFEAYTKYGDAPQPTYGDLAKRFSLTEWEVWKRLSTTREELRALMRLKVAETVRAPDEVDDEMNSLMALLP